jgi:hypothetical protein
MKTWCEEIQTIDEQIAHEQARRNDKQSVRQVSMKERVARLIREIPPERRGDQFPLSYFVEQLRAKYSGARAAPRDVARGLRECGWIRTRCWRTAPGDEAGFRALWSDPKSRNEQ